VFKTKIQMSPEGEAGSGGAAASAPAAATQPTPAAPQTAAPAAKPAEPAADAASAAAQPRTDPAPDLTKAGHYIPNGAMKALKEAERRRGRDEFVADLNKKAQAKGYKTYEEWLEKAPAAATKAGKDVAASGADSAPPTPEVPLTRKDRVLARQVEEERKMRQKAERRAREFEAQIAAREARAQIERVFVNGGVRDLDYAVSLLERETAGMTPEQAEVFDENAWLSKLRIDRPYLFGERIAAVDTTGGQESTPAGRAGTASALPPDQQPGAGKDPAAKNALSVDPKTGKYMMSEREKHAALQEILRSAGQGGPVLPKN
jgi:hypothetical protein